jgi:PAS domain S-box-containing protein
MTAMVNVPTSGTSDAELREAMYRSPLPLGLIDLAETTLIDANAPARAALGLGDDDFPRSVDQLLAGEDASHARDALRLVADGTLHAYETRRRFLRPDGTDVEGRVWVRSLAYLRAGYALAVFLPGPDTETGIDLSEVDFELPGTRVDVAGPVVVGSIDLDSSIRRISADCDRLLGAKAGALIDTPLVDRLHPDDVAAFLLTLGRALEDNAGVGMHARVRQPTGDYAPVRLLVTPMRQPAGVRFGIVISAEPIEDAPAVHTDSRVAELEQALWRIAREVQAAGIVDGMHRLPDDSEVPGISELSTRQWDVLTRLLRGERVPQIAKALYVSQSTVRNHLAAIFRKLGVHSQAELIALLRDPNQRNV